MSPTSLFVIIAGAVAGAGALLLVQGLRRTERAAKRVVRGGPSLLERLGRRSAVALGVGLVILVGTRWPVAAFAGVALVLGWNSLFGGARTERRAQARIEGLAAWTESLRDTIAGAVGLEQAIPATVYAASPAIKPQLSLMVDRLRVRVPLATALQGLADDLDDPAADLVVTALIMNAKLRGPGLRQVLTTLSESARAELDMRQRVAAERSSTRRSAQVVMGFSLFVMALIAVLNRRYLEPYDSAVGQMVLTVVVGLFGAGFAWMKRLSGIEMPARFLVATADRAPVRQHGGPR